LRRRKPWAAILCAVLLTGVTSCGGGGSNCVTPPPPAITYNVTVQDSCDGVTVNH
jgi:hypothetical protein